MAHEAFRSGNFDTKFVEKYFTPDVLTSKSNETEAMLAAVLAVTEMNSTKNKLNSIVPEVHRVSKWKKNRV